MTTQLIIPCAGPASRWNYHKDVPKQLVEVFGEPVMHRTVRLFRERVPDIAVCVVMRRDIELTVPDGVESVYVTQETADASYKITSSESAWYANTLIVVFGDVFFSEAAVDTIVAKELGNAIEWFGRNGPGISGCPYGEIFGLKFLSAQRHKLLDAAASVRRKRRAGRIPRAAGWEVYRELQGMPLVNKRGRLLPCRRIKGNFTVINDLTEDFDTPADYERWLKTGL
jgi:hypothetical protein